MAAFFDRFGGPRAWDAECDDEDRAYAALAGGRTCLDCGKCTPSARAGFGGVGWCHEAGEFVYAEDGTVAFQGLECFEGEVV